jgi:predicted nuclease of restriction endonuclease-like (RecB) superfamily
MKKNTSAASKKKVVSVKEYVQIFSDIKKQIQEAQLKAVLAANFDFLTLHSDYVERDVEQGLIDNIQKFLLELGKGFAFVARQYHLVVGGDDYYIDLLFYHYKLRCFIVVELKATAFTPRDAGQLNFYLSVVDDKLKASSDNPTIGILLCKTKNNITAEYALRDINKPIGVASYTEKLIDKLPKNLKSSLPTIEEIEAELEKNEIKVEDDKRV